MRPPLRQQRGRESNLWPPEATGGAFAPAHARRRAEGGRWPLREGPGNAARAGEAAAGTGPGGGGLLFLGGSGLGAEPCPLSGPLRGVAFPL